MKRRISMILAILMLCISFCAYAEEVPQFSDELFQTAKQAMVYLSSKEYERLVTLLPFSDVAPSATEWQNFAEGNFDSIEDVQTDYSVAYWTGEDWKLAVPVSEPTDGKVEALILTSADGVIFSGYRYSLWADVEDEYKDAEYVMWNKEYIKEDPVIAVD